MPPTSSFSSNLGPQSASDRLTVKRCQDNLIIPTVPSVTPTPTPVVTPANVSTDGVYAWGVNDQGQVGAGLSSKTVTYPTRILDANATTIIKSGREHNVVLHNGDIYYMGTNDDTLSQSGVYVNTATKLTVDIADSTTWNRIATNENHSLVISTTGAVYGFSNDFNYGSTGHTAQSGSFTQVAVTGGVHLIGAEVETGEFHSLAIGSDGNVWAWGRNNVGQLGNNSIQDTGVHHQAAVVSGVSNATHIYTNSTYHSCFAIDSLGDLYSWGGVQDTTNPTSGTPHILGRTGDPLVTDRVETSQRARYFSTGNDLNIAILKDYSFVMWGTFYDNQGTLQTIETPTQIIDTDTLEPVKGFRVSCQKYPNTTFRTALYVGFDTKVYYITPVSYDGVNVKADLQNISPDTNISSISASSDHYMLIKLNTANIYSLPHSESLIGEVI